MDAGLSSLPPEIRRDLEAFIADAADVKTSLSHASWVEIADGLTDDTTCPGMLISCISNIMNGSAADDVKDLKYGAKRINKALKEKKMPPFINPRILSGKAIRDSESAEHAIIPRLIVGDVHSRMQSGNTYNCITSTRSLVDVAQSEAKRYLDRYSVKPITPSAAPQTIEAPSSVYSSSSSSSSQSSSALSVAPAALPAPSAPPSSEDSKEGPVSSGFMDPDVVDGPARPTIRSRRGAQSQSASGSIVAGSSTPRTTRAQERTTASESSSCYEKCVTCCETTAAVVVGVIAFYFMIMTANEDNNHSNY